jgi:hypothetical protein
MKFIAARPHAQRVNVERKAGLESIAASRLTCRDAAPYEARKTSSDD